MEVRQRKIKFYIKLSFFKLNHMQWTTWKIICIILVMYVSLYTSQITGGEGMFLIPCSLWFYWFFSEFNQLHLHIVQVLNHNGINYYFTCLNFSLIFRNTIFLLLSVMLTTEHLGSKTKLQWTLHVFSNKGLTYSFHNEPQR